MSPKKWRVALCLVMFAVVCLAEDAPAQDSGATTVAEAAPADGEPAADSEAEADGEPEQIDPQLTDEPRCTHVSRGETVIREAVAEEESDYTMSCQCGSFRSKIVEGERQFAEGLWNCALDILDESCTGEAKQKNAEGQMEVTSVVEHCCRPSAEDSECKVQVEEQPPEPEPTLGPTPPPEKLTAPLRVELNLILKAFIAASCGMIGIEGVFVGIFICRHLKRFPPEG